MHLVMILQNIIFIQLSSKYIHYEFAWNKGFSRVPWIFISIVSCTDEPECVRYFNDLNKEIKHVLVYDDYNTKKKRIEKVQGKKFNYTFGDYIAEILISSINKNMDKIDAVKSNIKQLDTINKKNEFCFIC